MLYRQNGADNGKSATGFDSQYERLSLTGELSMSSLWNGIHGLIDIDLEHFAFTYFDFTQNASTYVG